MSSADRYETQWNLDYAIHLGETWGRFMQGLKDRKIWGTRCAGRPEVYVPPQAYSEAYFEPAEEWVEIADCGVLESWTISYLDFPGSPKAPFAAGAIRLDGASTMLLHLLSGADLASPETFAQTFRKGTRVKAVWADDRKGHILDILHFVPEQAS